MGRRMYGYAMIKEYSALKCDLKNYEVLSRKTYRVFTDSAAISDWAVGSVQLMSKLGVITGKPGDIFDPQGSATRAEVAAMLHRFATATAE